MLQPETIGAVIEGIAARLPPIRTAKSPGSESGHCGGHALSGLSDRGRQSPLWAYKAFPPALSALGRIHDGEDGLNAVALAKAAGFPRINLDLMHGLPGQTVAEGQRDIELALDAGVSHLSYYQLTIEPNTAFYRHRRSPRSRSSSASRTGGSAYSKQEALALRNLRLGPGRASLPAQPDLVALWGLPRSGTRGPWQAKPSGRRGRLR